MDEDYCPHCGGTGILEDTCVCNSFEDTCCCADPEPMECPECIEREHMAALAAVANSKPAAPR